MKISMDKMSEIGRIPDREGRMYAAAMAYANAGIAVIPIRKNGKAIPPSSTGVTYLQSSCDKDTITQWWGINGRFRGWNIGIACGGGATGVFAIDVDNHEGKANGLKAWEELVDTHGELAAPIQRTPTGGLHFLFQWVDDAASSTDKLAKGIDTRGGKDIQYSSHIVAFPSVTSDGAYEWLSGGDLIEPPEWTIEKLGRTWSPDVGTGRGSEEVGEDSLDKTVSLEDITNMLTHIDANSLSYQEWLNIGMAIKTQHPNEDGFEVWDAWSSTGERYKSDECFIRWGKFDPTGSIRMGTLIHYAREHGYDTSDLFDLGQFGEIIRKYNENHAVVMMGGKIRIAVRDEVSGSVDFLSKQDFGIWRGNDVVFVADAKGNAKPMKSCEVWLASEHRNTANRGVGFYPDKPFLYNDKVNLWQGWKIPPSQGGDWSLYKSHIENIICDGNDELAHFVLDWLAHMIQHPMKLPGSAIVLSGIEGCGKGTLPYFLGEALGKHYSHIVDSSHITGNFNSHLMDSLLIFADEVTYGGNRQIAGKLKAMVTETHMMSEKKGFEAIPYENRARLMVASNEDWFIPAGAESRRWLVLKVSGEVANNRQYFDNLYSSMAEGGTAAMLYDLQRRDITSNLAVAPVTEALIEQRVQYADSGNPIDRWWELCLERESTGCVDFGSTMDSIADEDTDWHRHIGRTELFEQYTEWAIKMGNAKYMKGNSAFYKRMEKYGVQPIRAKKPPIGSKKKTRPYVFIVPPIEQCIEIFDTLRGVTKEDE